MVFNASIGLLIIPAIAMFGGLHYENPEIQRSIDRVFQAQQDKAVAQAEADAAKQRKEALKLAGGGSWWRIPARIRVSVVVLALIWSR